jgi:hypothetical protein
MASAVLDRIAPSSTIPRKKAQDLEACKETVRGLEHGLVPLLYPPQRPRGPLPDKKTVVRLLVHKAPLPPRILSACKKNKWMTGRFPGLWLWKLVTQKITCESVLNERLLANKW